MIVARAVENWPEAITYSVAIVCSLAAFLIYVWATKSK